MSTRLFALAGVSIMVVIAQIGCGPAAAPTTDYPPAQEPSAPAATEAPAQEQLTERPLFPLFPVDKPSLVLLDPQGLSGAYGFFPTQVIAFTYPWGFVAIKAAGVQNPGVNFDNGKFPVVGYVEIGEGAQLLQPGTYLVEIDLWSTGSPVEGRLVALDAEKNSIERWLLFDRIPLERNPAREESPTFPPINPIITSNSVCFVIGQKEEGSGEVVQNAADAGSWSRYCSSTAMDTGEALLSVQANFPSDYEGLHARWDESLKRLAEFGYPTPPDTSIDRLQTISEIEGHTNIESCNRGGTDGCGSDITGAPNIWFWEFFPQAKDSSGGNDFIVTAGIVRIERLIEIPGQITILPGDYWVRNWFDPDGVFLGVTIQGVTFDNQVVSDQVIPAIPAYFLDQGNPETIVSWISGWRLCTWCKLQSNCP